MSDFEMLLSAWLNGGEIPADFKPTSNVEEYLLAILNGVDDDVDPKSRADVLLDAIAAKYAGYADGITDLRDETGMTAHHVAGSKPDQIAAFLRAINTIALQDLEAKGATGVNANTTDILNAYAILPSGGASVYDLPDNDSTVAISTLSTIADITGENCAVAIVALDTTSYSTTNKVNPTVAQLVYRTATLSGVSDSQASQIVSRGDYHGYIFGSKDDGCLIFTTPRANNAGLLAYPFLAILNMSDGNFTTCSVCAFGG